MEITTEPDVYMPSVDEFGNYVDKVPPFATLRHGLRCPCGSRKDKVYTRHGIFHSHIKTKTHQNWLSQLNLNKANYYVENEELKEIVQNQRLIIAQLERTIQTKGKTIDFLSQQLSALSNANVSNTPTVNNLLEFD